MRPPQTAQPHEKKATCRTARNLALSMENYFPIMSAFANWRDGENQNEKARKQLGLSKLRDDVLESPLNAQGLKFS